MVYFTIFLMVTGVIINSAFDVEFRILGIIYGLSGVFSCAIYTIWISNKQNELDLNNMQLFYYQAPLSAGTLISLILFVQIYQADKPLDNLQESALKMFSLQPDNLKYLSSLKEDLELKLQIPADNSKPHQHIDIHRFTNITVSDPETDSEDFSEHREIRDVGRYIKHMDRLAETENHSKSDQSGNADRFEITNFLEHTPETTTDPPTKSLSPKMTKNTQFVANETKNLMSQVSRHQKRSSNSKQNYEAAIATEQRKLIYYAAISAGSSYSFNLSIFWIIKNSSLITYIVFAKVKLCVGVFTGKFIFNEHVDNRQLYGMTMTLIGALMYSFIKLIENLKNGKNRAATREGTSITELM